MPLRKKVTLRTRKPNRKIGGRRFKVRKAGRKTTNRLTQRITSFVDKRPLDQMWPDRYYTKMRTSYIQTTSYTGTSAFGIGGNFLHNPVTSSITSGSIVAGSFGSTNSIAGLGALLSNPSATNNVTPYLQYRIHGCAITLELTNTSTAIQNSATIIATPQTFTSTQTQPNVNSITLNQQIEQPYTRHITVGGQVMNKVPRLRHFMSTRKMFGLKYKSQIEDVGYAGYSGTNPNYQWCYVVYVDPVTTNSTSLSIVVNATYTIEFFNRNYMVGVAG